MWSAGTGSLGAGQQRALRSRISFQPVQTWGWGMPALEGLLLRFISLCHAGTLSRVCVFQKTWVVLTGPGQGIKGKVLLLLPRLAWAGEQEPMRGAWGGGRLLGGLLPEYRRGSRQDFLRGCRVSCLPSVPVFPLECRLLPSHLCALARRPSPDLFPELL